MFSMFRKMICLVSFVLVLFLMSDVQAAVIWTDTTNDHLWSTPANWSSGTLPGPSSMVEIDLLPGPIITNEDAVASIITLGHGNSTGELTVDGGTLTAKWIRLAYDEESRGTLNMNSGVITLGHDLFVGYEGLGIFNMTGGAITMMGGFYIADTSTAAGYANLDGGTITVRAFRINRRSSPMGTMDVRAGTLIINSRWLSIVQAYINEGWITAYDDNGTLQLDHDVTNKDKTTLKAVHFLNPSPVDGSDVLPIGVNQLQWTLPEPKQPGGVVTCVVRFGTNPVIEDNPKVVIGQAVESVPVVLDINMTYYWALDLYDSSISTTEPYMLSPVFTFTTINRAPTVNAGTDVVTWLTDGVRTGNLDATVTDEGMLLPYTVHWTVVSEPNNPNSPDAVITDPNAEDASVALAAVGKYVLQLEAFDGECTGSDTVTINVCNDSCEAAQSLPGYVPLVGDLNGDCRVDEADMTLLEENWLEENSLIEDWFKLE